MNYWHSDGSFSLHVFHKNNERAGYCSVLHAMQLLGITGEYGRPLRAAVISFGATGRGAVTALNAHGVNMVDVLTHREVTAVAAPIHSARMVHFERDTGNSARCHVLGGKRPGAAGRLACRVRHRGQLRAPAHRRATDVRHRR
jgi:alanine dehydrogenase